MRENKSVIASLLESKKNGLESLQTMIEERTAKHERNAFVWKCIEPLVSEQVVRVAEECKLEPKFVKQLYILGVLHQTKDKWRNIPANIIAGAFLREFKGDGKLASEACEKFLKSEQQTAIFYRLDRTGTLKLNGSLHLDAEEIEALDKYQFPMPMICPPARLSAKCDGYLLGKGQPSSYFNPGLKYYDLEKANSIAFTFSEFMNVDVNINFDVKIYKGEDHYMKAYDAFCLKESRAELVYDTFTQLGIDKFYFTHFGCGRVRIYCNGWQFSEQARDLDKARLAFAESEPVTDLGMAGLRIGIANALGLDKKSFKERIDFVVEHDAELEKLMLETEERSDYPDGHRIQYKADEPYIGISLIRYYRKAQRGEPVNCIVYADAVNQGFQLQSIICSDRDMMEMTCAIGQKRNDMYNHYLKLCGLDKKYRPMLKIGLVPMGYGATTAAINKIGQEFYNRIVKASEVFPTWRFIWSIPGLWNPDWESVSWTLPDGIKTLTYPKDKSEDEDGVYMKRMVVLGTTFNLPYHPEIIKVERSCCLGPNMIHSIDGFIAREMMSRCYHDPKKIRWIRDYLFGLVTTFEDKCDMNHPVTKELLEVLRLGKECNWYSFHILDLVNAYNIHLVPEKVLKEMINELPEKPFPITRIHDSFGCHPNYLRDVMVQYRHCLYHLGVSNLMQHIADEIGIDLKIPHKNLALMEMIKEEKYALC